VPVTVTVDGERLRGTTLDLSEGGAACAVTPGAAALPVPGSRPEVELVLDHERVWLRSHLLTAVHRRGWWILTVAFAEPPERDQDLLRRHVFTVLRRDRAAGFG
jgi:c-di-GMP-binding flagellar brake protein YcgR